MALTIRTTVLAVHSEISLLLLCYATLLVMLRIGAMRLCYAMQLCCYAKLRGCAMLRSYVVLRSYAMLLVRRELLAQSWGLRRALLRTRRNGKRYCIRPPPLGTLWKESTRAGLEVSREEPEE